MSVISVRPKKDGVSHVADLVGREYTVELLAEVSDLSTGPIAIRDWLAAAGFTAGAYYRWPLGSPTEVDYASYLQRVRIAPAAATGLVYGVTLEYRPVDVVNNGPAQGSQINNWIMAPTLAPPTLKWSSEDVEFACTHDRDGKPILNKAGDPFDPPITIFLATPVATISRVEATFNPAWITIYKETVNDGAWMGFPSESVLCKDITADQFHSPDHGYLFTVNYKFAFRPSVLGSDGETVIRAGWDAQVLNAGKRELRLRPPLVEPTRVPIFIDDAPVSDPVPLDDNGQYDPEGEPNYLRFAIHPKKDFSFFNFPANLFSAT